MENVNKEIVNDIMVMIMDVCRIFLVAHGSDVAIEKTLWWWREENPLLGNVSPLDLIEMGREHKVRQFIDAAIFENKI